MRADARRARRVLPGATPLLIAVLLVGCGQTGPLILPGEVTEPPDPEVPLGAETNDDEDQDED